MSHPTADSVDGVDAHTTTGDPPPTSISFRIALVFRQPEAAADLAAALTEASSLISVREPRKGDGNTGSELDLTIFSDDIWLAVLQAMTMTHNYGYPPLSVEASQIAA